MVGGPDEERGERVVAFVVPSPAADGAALVRAVEDACRHTLASYKRPREVRLCAAVPRDPTGKLLRIRLRDELWQGRRPFAASS